MREMYIVWWCEGERPAVLAAEIRRRVQFGAHAAEVARVHGPSWIRPRRQFTCPAHEPATARIFTYAALRAHNRREAS
jgi:hypothetical protein